MFVPSSRYGWWQLLAVQTHICYKQQEENRQETGRFQLSECF